MNKPHRHVPPLANIEVYEIDVRREHFGRVRSRWPEPESDPRFRPKGCCYALRYEASTPCDGCPAAEVSADRPYVTRIVTVDGMPGVYDVVTAEYVDPHAARLVVRRIDEDVLSGLLRARIERLAEDAKLTAREREILPYLLMGRSRGEIGRLLGISPRTVKFHQMNLLDKLGADARADLPRLIL